MNCRVLGKGDGIGQDIKWRDPTTEVFVVLPHTCKPAVGQTGLHFAVCIMRKPTSWGELPFTVANKIDRSTFPSFSAAGGKSTYDGFFEGGIA